MGTGFRLKSEDGTLLKTEMENYRVGMHKKHMAMMYYVVSELAVYFPG